jgi:hypothetical protein
MKSSVVLKMIFMLTFAVPLAFAQKEGQTRAITMSSFASKRPAEAGGKPQGSAAAAAARKNGTYKSVGAVKGSAAGSVKLVLGAKSVARPKAAPMETRTADIGVTMWKLRPPIPTDTGRPIPVRVGDGTQMWTAERVSTKTQFRSGDRVRFAVESSEDGYLYIFNSEMLANGRTGEPCMIFPNAVTDDNSVRAGSPVEVPDQSERLPYFLINPERPEYRGESMTIVISDTKLNDLKLTKDASCGSRLAAGQVSRFAAGDVEIFERDDRVDAIYSDAEAAAVCGVKTRELVREQPNEKPCSERRQMSSEDPLPQSIYRVTSPKDRPVVATVRLDVPN